MKSTKQNRKTFLICSAVIAAVFAYFLLLATISFWEFRSVLPALFRQKAAFHFRNPWILNAGGGRKETKKTIDFFAPKNADAENLSVNFFFLERLLDLYGPIAQKDFFEAYANQKINLESLLEKIETRMALYFWNYPKLAFAVKQGLLLKEITFESAKTNFPTDNDFIYITFKNKTSLPLDRYLVKQMSYTVNFKDSGEIEANLSIMVFHRGQEMPPFSGNYRGEISIFVPIESEVIAAAADSESTEAASHVFKKSLELNPGQNTMLFFKYMLPRRFKSGGRYKLALFKQPSAELNYQISAKTNEDFVFESEDFDVKEFFAAKSGILDRDKSFALKIMPIETPLLLTEAKFIGDEIKLAFNRVPQATSATDGLNYIIEDTNKISPDVTDQVLITGVKQEGKNVFLRIRKASRKPEIYKLTIKNLIDRNKNKLSSSGYSVEISR